MGPKIYCESIIIYIRYSIKIHFKGKKSMIVQRKLANEPTLSNTQIVCDYYLI